MKDNKLVTAVIGAGMIANKAHIPAYKSLFEQVSMEAVFDLSEEAALHTAQAHDIPFHYTDAERMLKEIKPDLVSVCTPNMSHAGFVRMALENGCNVLCEKPLAMTWKETRALYDLAKEKGRLLMACQTLRCGEEFLAAKEMADTGMLGDIYFAEFAAIRRRGIPKWGVFHRKEDNGGGALCDLGVHLIDALVWLMGSPAFTAVRGYSAAHIAQHEKNVISSIVESGAPAGVTRALKYRPEEFEVEEFAAGTLHFENGINVNFKTSWALNLPPQFGLSIAGTKAGLTLPDLKFYTVMGRYQADIAPRVFNEGPHAKEPFSGHFTLIKNAADHLMYGTPVLVTPEQTLTVAAIIDAFYLSAKLQREVYAEEVYTA